MKILMIGNSHGLDATRMVYDVFGAEMPQEDMVVGALYVNGCSMIRHAYYATEEMPVYVYHKNTAGVWEETKETSSKTALQDENWDVIVMQELNTVAGMDERYETEDMNTLVAYVRANTQGNPKLVWQLMWTNPTDPSFFQPGVKTMDMPEGWDERYKLRNNLSRNDLYDKIIACTHKYILPRTDLDLVIPSGTAVQYAKDVLNLTDDDLNRDYGHLSEFARVLVAYVWYAALTGKKELTDIKLDAVRLPIRFCNKRFQPTEDLEITAAQKKIILESVNYALKNPYKLP